MIEKSTAEGDKIVISMVTDKTIPNDMNADWVKYHIAQLEKHLNYLKKQIVKFSEVELYYLKCKHARIK